MEGEERWRNLKEGEDHMKDSEGDQSPPCDSIIIKTIISANKRFRWRGSKEVKGKDSMARESWRRIYSRS